MPPPAFVCPFEGSSAVVDKFSPNFRFTQEPGLTHLPLLRVGAAAGARYLGMNMFLQLNVDGYVNSEASVPTRDQSSVNIAAKGGLLSWPVAPVRIIWSEGIHHLT